MGLECVEGLLVTPHLVHVKVMHTCVGLCQIINKLELTVVSYVFEEATTRSMVVLIVARADS